MTLPFTSHIFLDPKDHKRIIRNGYISCDVFLSGSTRPRCMGYCLHCKRLFSLSWATKHTRRLRRRMGDVTRFFNPDKVDFCREDIRSELELLFENGRFSRQSHEFNECVISDGNVDVQTVNRLESEDCPNESHELGDANSERGAQAVSPDKQSRRTEDLEHDCASIRDRLLKCSFYHSEFDSEKIFSWLKQ